MGFVDSIKKVYSNYFNFKGRASRSEFWWFYLFMIIIVFGLSFLSGMLPDLEGVFGIVLVVFFLATILPYLGVLARRMHDSDKSGWFMLIPFYNLYLAIIKGTDGPNRFGPDPVGPNVDTFS